MEVNSLRSHTDRSSGPAAAAPACSRVVGQQEDGHQHGQVRVGQHRRDLVGDLWDSTCMTPSPRARSLLLGRRPSAGLGLAPVSPHGPMHPQVTPSPVPLYHSAPPGLVASTVLQTGAALRAVQGIRGNRDAQPDPQACSLDPIPKGRVLLRKQFSIVTMQSVGNSAENNQ